MENVFMFICPGALWERNENYKIINSSRMNRISIWQILDPQLYNALAESFLHLNTIMCM